VKALTRMVVAAWLLRLALMFFFLPEHLDPSRDHWHFGFEVGRIARALAQGHGFSSPLFAETGPTAWMTPVYPSIVAAIFSVFGIYTPTSALVILSFNALTSALTCIPIFFIARRTFGNREALWAGWSWAFFPYAIYFPLERIWETWLATLLLCLLFLFVLHLESTSATGAWLGFGSLAGLAALTSPVLVSVLPFMAGWACCRLRRRRQAWLRPAAVAALAFVICVAPWFVRNYHVFHRFIPFRDNMGLVLRLGTKGTTNHWAASELGPWHSDAEWAQFQQLGELGYMEKEKRQALEFIGSHPGWYAWTSLRRAIYIWTGYWSLDPGYLAQEPLDPPNIFFSTTFTVFALIGLWRAFRLNAPVAALFALVLVIFPAIYYITNPEVYYRRPIDPLMVVLAASLVTLRKRRIKPAEHLESGRAEREPVEA